MEIKGKLYVFVKDYKGVKLLSTSIQTKGKGGEPTGNYYMNVYLTSDLKGKEKKFLEGFYYVLEVEEGFLSAFKDKGEERPAKLSVVVTKGKVLEKNPIIKKVDEPNDADLPF